MPAAWRQLWHIFHPPASPLIVPVRLAQHDPTGAPQGSAMFAAGTGAGAGAGAGTAAGAGAGPWAGPAAMVGADADADADADESKKSMIDQVYDTLHDIFASDAQLLVRLECWPVCCGFASRWAHGRVVRPQTLEFPGRVLDEVCAVPVCGCVSLPNSS